jgi:hypothetical protein
MHTIELLSSYTSHLQLLATELQTFQSAWHRLTKRSYVVKDIDLKTTPPPPPDLRLEAPRSCIPSYPWAAAMDERNIPHALSLLGARAQVPYMLSDAALARLTAHCAALATDATADAATNFTAPAVGFDLQGDAVRNAETGRGWLPRRADSTDRAR